MVQRLKININIKNGSGRGQHKDFQRGGFRGSKFGEANFSSISNVINDCVDFLCKFS